MQKNKEKQLKVYKGVFISNERKKRAGGRIKCEEFRNKIEVMGRNQAIHQSEVEWTEVRRYKREKKQPRNQSKPNQNKKDTQNSKEKEVNKNDKNLKYKQKEQTAKEIQKQQSINKTQEKQKSQEKNQFKDSKIEKVIKKKKFKVKQESIQQPQSNNSQSANISETKTQQPSEKSAENQTNNETNEKIQSKDIEQATDRRNKNETNDRENQQQSRKQQAQSQESSQQEDLEIIVGRIKKQTNIKFKSKPFVGILDFQKRKNIKNRKQRLQNPIEQILSDYYADLKPIHARLPIMELDDLRVQNYQVLYDYATNIVKQDKKIPRSKYLNKILDELSSVYILMTFSEWDGDIPLANIHKIIGKAKTIDGECQRFLYEHGLNDFHYQQVQFEEIPINPTPKHKNVQQMVFTIDPPTSTDLDDALSIQKVNQHLYRVGIHIADVTSYLHLIDRDQISKRTTSVYLPYKVYHMLNRNLVKVCSLDPGVERLAFTVWVKMDTDGNVIGQSVIEKSIIKSRFKLSYAIVQDLISGLMDYKKFSDIYPCQEEEYEALLEKLLIMADIALAHRNQRIIFDVFQNKEMEFKVDEDRWPIQCYVDKRFAAKKIVQEFMIIGNIESAKFMIKVNPNNALVIHHPKPSKLAVSQFNQQFKSLETKFKFENVLDVQKQLLKISENNDIKQQTKNILFFKARRVMQPAIYRKYGEIKDEAKDKETQQKQAKQKEPIKKKQVEEFPIIHFALGLQFYTHFTSPMRRMADIVVHQTLTQMITGQKVTDLSADQIEKINNGRRSTKRLKKDLNQVYLCLMIYHTRKPIVCEGIISSFGLESVSIFIPIFDMQKEVLWKKQFKIHSIRRIRNKQNQLDVKLYHDRKTAKNDIYWVIQRFQKVQLTLLCTQDPPLKLIIKMKVQSEKGPFTIEWIEEQ